jgi:glycosyltransferase involved in cell wall biosynthesis
MRARALRAPADGLAARARRARRSERRAPVAEIVMLLENSTYPLDARVRNEALSLTASGRTVEVLAPRAAGEARRELIDGIRVTRLPLLDGRGALLGTAIEYLSACCMMGAAVLLRLARSRRGTLHVHNPPDVFFPLLLLARLRGWSTVFDHHDDAVGMLRDKLGRRSRMEVILAWMRNLTARVSDLTITTNDTQRELLRPAARQVVIVRNDPPAWFRDHRPSPPNGHARLVFLGEIGKQDRVVLAVDILALLVEQHGLDADLLVIGDGPERPAVEQRAQALGLSSRVEVTGWVPYEQVPVLLASAHVGLDTAPLTDVNHGSTMVKILEYLAVGLPTVASALRETKISGAGAVTTIEDDSAAAFAAPALELLTSAECWQRRAAEARARGLENQWSKQAATLLAAYPARR